MKSITIKLSYYDVVHMLQSDARKLAEAEKLSHAEILERAERMQKYPAMLKEAWGSGFGNG